MRGEAGEQGVEEGGAGEAEGSVSGWGFGLREVERQRKKRRR
jgi:hypothetical protein